MSAQSGPYRDYMEPGRPPLWGAWYSPSERMWFAVVDGWPVEGELYLTAQAAQDRVNQLVEELREWKNGRGS